MQLSQSVWQRLKLQEISCTQALDYLVSAEGVLNLQLLDPEVSLRFCRHFSNKKALPPVVPLLLWQNCFYLGCSIELCPMAVKQLEEQLNASVQIVHITEKSYQRWKRIQFVQSIRTASLGKALEELEQDEDIGEVAELSLAQTANQIERIRTLISSALRNRASDIHLAPSPTGLEVRFRIDGILRYITTFPPDLSRRVIVSLKVMCDMDIAESRRPQDGRIGEKYMSGEEEQGLDLRVSTLPCISSTKGEPAEKAVLRLLRQQNSFTTIENLGFSERPREIFEGWLREPQGMIILTGPTGSGKTSTLYTSLTSIAKESVNICTVEDPVEYVLPGITQTQVHELAGMTFAAGLRAILRQDPDIIMVGEIRDSGTAETAIRAALTGHLVLTTLHTNDAIGAIPRLKDIGPDPGLISDALLGIVAQRLVRRICPHCAQPYIPTATELSVLGLKEGEVNLQQCRKGKGCSQCFNSGYLGREAVIELLNVDDVVRQIIYEGTTTQLRRYLNEVRFHSFKIAAIEKVVKGITTIDEVRRVLPHSVLVHRASDNSVIKHLNTA